MRILSTLFLGIVSLILADDAVSMISNSNDTTITSTNNIKECLKNMDCPIINCIQAPCPTYVCHQNKCDIRHVQVQVQPVVVADPVQVSAGATCGKNTCSNDEFCCNESCGICAPENGTCFEIECIDNSSSNYNNNNTNNTPTRKPQVAKTATTTSKTTTVFNVSSTPFRSQPFNNSSVVKCGKNTCQRNEVCCNKSCSICTPKNGICIQKVCNDNDNNATSITRKPRRQPVQIRVPVPPSTTGKKVKCGPNTCTGNDVCCNESCGICTPKDGFCSMMFCDDAAAVVPSGGGTPVATIPTIPTKSISVIAPAKSPSKLNNNNNNNKPSPVSISSGSCKSDNDCPSSPDCLLDSKKRCPYSKCFTNKCKLVFPKQQSQTSQSCIIDDDCPRKCSSSSGSATQNKVVSRIMDRVTRKLQKQQPCIKSIQQYCVNKKCTIDKNSIIQCGTVQCKKNEYCCNESCSICINVFSKIKCPTDTCSINTSTTNTTSSTSTSTTTTVPSP